MNNERYYSVKPGEVILHGKEPIEVKYRRELADYLSKYPRGKDKNDLKQRLRSYTESGFYSACFELFLYSLLSGRGGKVIPHPVLPNISTRPEFEIVHDLCNFFLEATLALGACPSNRSTTYGLGDEGMVRERKRRGFRAMDGGLPRNVWKRATIVRARQPELPA